MKNILYITGTRADYGLMRNTLLEINKNPELNLTVIATGMHLMKKYGFTIDEIKKDNEKYHFNLIAINSTFKDNSRFSQASFFGDFSGKLTKKLEEVKCEIVLLLGDRIEMLAAASVATYLGKLIAHIHGGDISSTVDDQVRHAITKLSHVHLTATKDSAERIIKMGEEKSNVYVVGAPGLDKINDLFSKEEVEKHFGLDLSKKTALVLQHSISERIEDSKDQMMQTLEAIKELKIQSIIIYPNSDPGSGEMINLIEKYRKENIENDKDQFIKVFKNIEHKMFLSLMQNVSVMIGNSSSGIIESSSFKLPVVNIGSRQNNRQRSTNVIDVSYDKEEIVSAIGKSINNKDYLETLKDCINPYGDGKTGPKITKILSTIKLNNLQKKMTY